MKRRTPLILVCLSGLAVAALVGCGPSKPGRVGSPIRDPNAPLELRPGAPAMAADGEVYEGAPRKAAPKPATPPKVEVAANPPAPKPAPPAANPTPAKPAPAKPSPTPAREPAIDLGGDEPAPKPVQPAPTQPAAKPMPTPGRPPVIDLEDSGKPAPDQPAPRPTAPKPTPRPAPAPTPAADPAEEPVQPQAPVDAKSLEAMNARAIELIQALSRSEQADVRANAAEAAGMIPKKLEQVITTALADRNEGVQAIAAMTIGKQRLVSLTPRVRPLLNSPSPYVETAAIMALVRNNEPVDDAKMSRLGELLFTSTSPRIKAHVAYLVGEIGNASALPMLKDAAAIKMPLASQAEVSSMLLQMAEAMVKLGDTDQIDTIRAALVPARPEDLESTAVAVQILGELGDRRPMDQLVYLSAYRDPGTHAPYPAEVRMQVASSMAKLGRDKGGFIADEFWKSPEPALRAQAAGVYGDTARTEHLEKLAALMEDPVEQVRITAAAAVLKISKKAAAVAK